MTPHDIEVLLHHYCSTARWKYASSGAYEQSTKWMIEEELLEYREGILRSTPRGDALVAMLCATPLPVQAFIHPMTGERVDTP